MSRNRWTRQCRPPLICRDKIQSGARVDMSTTWPPLLYRQTRQTWTDLWQDDRTDGPPCRCSVDYVLDSTRTGFFVVSTDVDSEGVVGLHHSVRYHLTSNQKELGCSHLARMLTFGITLILRFTVIYVGVRPKTVLRFPYHFI